MHKSDDIIVEVQIDEQEIMIAWIYIYTFNDCTVLYTCIHNPHRYSHRWINKGENYSIVL